ncbi:heavy-metal-associated domain-containing protein [Lignipirellula cremea]|uniref:Heavy-metal-associated domain protein n=1 Tax=Lignipirellula cremea TaxID=2528010 RepID=A0A518DPP5_9BACT|nr:heavy metal-associated domain-containing protein [Lignipirellula cremea]QDU93796.1 Heavy-metal-associated domain protein [Lignipirellula cremea]
MSPRICAVLMALACVAFAADLTAAEPEPVWTNVKVRDMCCAGCAQKIAARLYTVRGVKEVRANVQQKTLYVAAQPNVVLSPKAIWEAVEKAKDLPLRLAGPNGVFEAKPNY